MATAEDKKITARKTAAAKKTVKVTEEEKKDFYAIPRTLVNIRVVPDGAIAGQAAAGKELKILGQQGDWLQTSRGWVHARLCVIVER